MANRGIRVILLIVLLASFYGCAGIINMNPDLSQISVNSKIPLDTAIFLDPETVHYTYNTEPGTFGCGWMKHEIMLGSALEKASRDVFARTFKTSYITTSREEAQQYALMLEPHIEDFRLSYDMGFYYSSLKLKFTLSNNGKTIWESVFESPDESKFSGFVYCSDSAGKVASAALEKTMEKAVQELGSKSSFIISSAQQGKVEPQVETGRSRKTVTISAAVQKQSSSDIDHIPNFKAMLREDDLAVVIGIENYQDIPKSDYSVSDARLVKEYLKAIGFKERNIELITDERATKSGIEKAMEAWLPNRIKKDSTVFIYFSGHGAPEPSTGDAYIVPFDGDPNYLSVTGYPLRRMYDKLSKLGANEVITVLDSCFSGAGGRSVLAKGARPLVMTPHAPSLPDNMVVLSATQNSQISTSSPEKGHGVFTYYFLKAIKDGKNDLADIYAALKPQVEDEAKSMNVQQQPSMVPATSNAKGRFVMRK